MFGILTRIKRLLIPPVDDLLTFLRDAGRPNFHSPVVDAKDPRVREVLGRFRSAELPPREDLALDEGLILQTLLRISAHYDQVPFSETKRDGWRYYYRNPMYSYGDAVVLFCMLLDLRPKRLIEAGCGYSSCVTMDTNDRFLERSMECTFIDPLPASVLSLLDDNDSYRARMIPKPLQEVPLETFTRLEANDILFIDSSHVSKVASDVNDCFFRILPALKPGVVIHFHDISYPFDYPPESILEQRLSWNEAYLLRAFLQYNERYQVIYFNHFAYRRFESVLAERMPLCLRNCGAGIWLRKR